HVQMGRPCPLHQPTVDGRHRHFLFPYSITVSPVSAFFSSVIRAGSPVQAILPDWKTCLPCSRCTSTLTVYVPCGRAFPLSSLPSQTTVYLPGARVARVTARIRVLSSLATFHQPDIVGSQRLWLPQTRTVRTGLPSAPSIQMAT